MFINGLGTATPPKRYTQLEGWDALLASRRYFELIPRSQAILEKVLTSDNGIKTRFLAVDDLSEGLIRTPDDFARALRETCSGGSYASRRARLTDAGIQRRRD